MGKMADTKKEKKLIKMPYEKRKGLYGYGFIALWLVGTLIWFVYPLLESLRYSFMEVKPEAGGMQGTWVGLDNFNTMLSWSGGAGGTLDPYFFYLLKEASHAGSGIGSQGSPVIV